MVVLTTAVGEIEVAVLLLTSVLAEVRIFMKTVFFSSSEW